MGCDQVDARQGAASGVLSWDSPRLPQRFRTVQYRHTLEQWSLWIEEADLISVADALVGQALELRQVGTEDPARLRYLAEQGLVPGAHLTVTDRQPFNGPTTVRLGAGPRVIGRELAQLLWCREATR